MKKIFGEFKITWKFLIIFSSLLGIGVGIINRIPALYNTSFQDIAIVFDMWIVLAIFIIVNCKNIKEAILKTFVFFLISQPLIYFTEAIMDTIFYKADFIKQLVLYFNNYYIGADWLAWTILTIPGSFIAYYIKKDNILSSIILSVATGYLCFSGTTGLIECIMNHFPYHLLNSLLCFLFAFLLIFIILKDKKNRIISCSLNIVGVIIAIILIINRNSTPINASDMISIDEDKEIIECKIDNEKIATAKISDEKYYVDVHSGTDLGKTNMELTDNDGNKYYYVIESTSNNFEIKEK